MAFNKRLLRRGSCPPGLPLLRLPAFVIRFMKEQLVWEASTYGSPRAISISCMELLINLQEMEAAGKRLAAFSGKLCGLSYLLDIVTGSLHLFVNLNQHFNSFVCVRACVFSRLPLNRYTKTQPTEFGFSFFKMGCTATCYFNVVT